MNPTERIGDLPKPEKFEHTVDRKVPCQYPQHFAARNIVRRPGRYKHTCPQCGEVTYFTIWEDGVWT